MTIAKRLIILLAVPLVALLALGIFTRVELSRIEERARFVAVSQIGSLAVLGNVSRSFAELRVNVRSYVLATNAAQRASARALFDEDEQEVTRLIQQYGDSLISDEPNRRLYSDYRDLSREWISGARQVMTLAEAGRHEDAAARRATCATSTGWANCAESQTKSIRAAPH